MNDILGFAYDIAIWGILLDFTALSQHWLR